MTGWGPAAAAAPQATAPRAWVRRLAVRDFRNLRRVELEPPREGLALVGENGQGKTNFLEAIYYLQLLRSFRGARDREMVTFGADGFHLSAEIEGARAHAVAVGFESATRRKKVRLDGGEADRLVDALGAFPAVLFSPHDAALVSGSPGERRRYLDVVLALTAPGYLAALQRYRSALANRHAAMRGSGGGGGATSAPDIERHVAVWEPALAESGALLWRARRAWVDAHAARYGELCAAMGERGEATLRLVRTPEPEDDGPAAFVAALERRRALDIRRGATHAGPHRDELALALDARDLRTYGSAGQQRTAAIALRLLEADTLRAHAGTEPVVLLDDPFAELDARRAARILELVDGGAAQQTVLAVPREQDIPPALTRLARWRIAGGALVRGEP